jgi:hypothetical protein
MRVAELVHVATRSRAEYAITGATLLAWAIILACMLTHSVVVSNDSISNYAHVWFISDRLWSGAGLPLHFPAIGHGEGMAFPYASIPWLLAASFEPLAGDWATTAVMVAGAVALATCTFVAFPELRPPLPMAIVLVNPALLESVALFQLPFAWGAAFLMLAIGAWRTERVPLAWLALTGALVTHLVVILPIAACFGAWAFASDGGRRRSLLIVAGGAMVASLPAAFMVLASPVTADVSVAAAMANLAGTLAIRGFVFVVPVLLVLVLRHKPAFPLPAIVAALVVANTLLIPARSTAWAWGSLWRQPERNFEEFLSSGAFHPGERYRVLRVNDGKYTMYQVLRAGGSLDSEFFPESFARRSWETDTEYVAFLASRGVDHVAIFDNYSARYHTNEATLLDALVARGCAVVEWRGDGYRVVAVATGAHPVAGQEAQGGC